MKDLAIIIVSWNTRDLLRECIQSIYEFTNEITYEIYVVDNASSDGSAEMVEKNFTQVQVIANRENLGFSKANNQAIRLSNSRYIALLNPDTLLIEDVFSPLVRYADEHKEIGAIGPKILSKDRRTIQRACARKLPTLYSEFCNLSGLAYKFPHRKLFHGYFLSAEDYRSSKYLQALSGSCMVVKQAAIDDVGFMDENQFMYADEIDWCKRMLDRKWKIYYHSNVAIIHYGGESSKQVKHFANIESQEARWYYYHKHHGVFYAEIFRALVVFFMLIKYIWSKMLRLKTCHAKELIEFYKRSFQWAIKKKIYKL